MGEAKRRAVSGHKRQGENGKRLPKRRLLPSRLTWKSVGLFLFTLACLDVALYFVFELGLGKCYGILCLF